MSPYWNRATANGLIPDPKNQSYIAGTNSGDKYAVMDAAGPYMENTIAKDPTIRFVIIAHSAGADSAVLLADRYGQAAVGALVLLDPPLDAGLKNGGDVKLQNMANSVASKIPTLVGSSQDGTQSISGAVNEDYAGHHDDLALNAQFANQNVTLFLQNYLPDLPWGSAP